MDNPGPSWSSDKDRMEAAMSALNMIAQGKRNMVCGEIPTAVNQFQEACKVLSKSYGETAKECAEAYYQYGRALLDLARMETGVLGNALQGVPEEEDGEKSADEQFEKGDMEGESSSTKNSTEDEEEEGTEEEGTEEDEDESEAVDTAEEGDNSQEEGSQGEKEGEENADDVSNLQLAWEMLELAKVIYLKDEDKEAKLKASDAYLKLGEVSLETEQYAQSISDFTECLNIQKSVLDPDDRSLAETYYQLGLAYSFNKEYDESIDSFRAAVKVMESKIDSLQKRLDDDKFPPPKEGSFDDPKKLAEQEINDLKEILPDIRGKVEEVIEERRQIEELKKMAKEGMSVITESLGLQKPEEKSKDEPKKPVSDISHLIRRKRKPDEEEEPVEPKKSRQENGSGDAPPKVNGVNGDKESMDVDDKKADSEAPKPTEAVAS
ncbi:protein HGV2-like isoform X2 [Ylistrum balloti]|uniref:protein HGV2-like isoform X2 n=1 Tax=Ylistrum balloti TaxID=509963 RepID=UPI002905B18D|nr:protein HGV2-like isoform X2 [Ylistrum balloti]